MTVYICSAEWQGGSRLLRGRKRRRRASGRSASNAWKWGGLPRKGRKVVAGGKKVG